MIKLNLSILFLLLGVFSLTFNSVNEDISSFEREITSIYNEIQDALSDEYEIDQLINTTEKVISDIEYFKKRNDNLQSNSVLKLNQLKSEAEILVRFFYVIDRTSGMIEKNDFFRILNKAGGNLTTLFSSSNCADILKLDLGDFSGYYAENKTENKSFKVKWSLTNTRYGLVGSSGEMGLIRRNIRHIVNSRDNEDFKLLKPKSISCEEIPYDF